MVIDIIMPKMGESITEGTILEWRKKVGDQIKMDEILLEIGTDKVDSEIPSSVEGTIIEILAETNEVIEVGKVIARIETEGSSINKEPTTAKSKPDAPSAALHDIPPTHRTTAAKVPGSSRETNSRSGRGKRFYTPVVKTIARREKISFEELDSIKGTGHNNRVTKRDVLKYLVRKTSAVVDSIPDVTPTIAPLPAGRVLGDERIEMDHMRKLIAEHMRKSLDTSAHVFVMTEADMTHIVNYVHQYDDQFRKNEGFPLTYTPFIVAAVVGALQNYPDMNSSLEGTSIIHKKNINMGIAVAVEGGLMVPVIAHCEELNFLGICRKVRDLAVRTRNKQLQPDELQGSTFSITNFGVFNVTVGTPIINQPNVGILGVGTIKKKPVVVETSQGDTIGIRSMMMLSLGFDHRLIDGAGGSKFIDAVRQNLETVEVDHLF